MKESFSKSLSDISFRTPGDRLGGINCQRQDDSKQGGGTCASSETQAFCEIQQQRQRQWWKFKGTTTLRKGNYEIIYSKASHPYHCSNRRQQEVHWSGSSTSSPGTLECLERGDVRSSSFNLWWVALTIGLYVLTRSSHVIRIGYNRSGTP